MKMARYAILLLTFATWFVNGHGGIYNYTIDGVDYPGHYPWLPEAGQESIQRRWWPDPIYTPKHPYLACNRGNPLATSLPTLHAPVRAGAEVQAWYRAPHCPITSVPFPTTPSVPEYGDPDPPMQCAGPTYSWPHSLGPMFVYMASCDGPCDSWDGSGKRWFKIWDSGYFKKGAPHWPDWQLDGQDQAVANSYAWQQYAIGYYGMNVTIPKSLKPGKYLIRHEVIMIESTLQIYPECAQLDVSGDGDAVPDKEYLVEFPGAYSDDDPGLAIASRIYEPYGHNTYNYTMPGPKVWDPEAA
ncbi:lytic polysaccharide monooxygenase [Xylariaceae sp. AK1471]|nr:lytic polysaccharide monooxygenase [Xylariaceae sp. AK1471]